MGTMHRAVVMAGVFGMLAISSWQPAQASFSNKGSRAQQQR